MTTVALSMNDNLLCAIAISQLLQYADTPVINSVYRVSSLPQRVHSIIFTISTWYLCYT